MGASSLKSLANQKHQKATGSWLWCRIALSGAADLHLSTSPNYLLHEWVSRGNDTRGRGQLRDSHNLLCKRRRHRCHSKWERFPPNIHHRGQLSLATRVAWEPEEKKHWVFFLLAHCAPRVSLYYESKPKGLALEPKYVEEQSAQSLGAPTCLPLYVNCKSSTPHITFFMY
jgi:hypothetical protein